MKFSHLSTEKKMRVCSRFCGEVGKWRYYGDIAKRRKGLDENDCNENDGDFHRGMALVMDGKHAEAVGWFTNAVSNGAMVAGRHRAVAARASCLEQLSGMGCFSCASIFFSKGRKRLGRLEEAEQDYRKVVALTPSSPPAYVALASCLSARGKLEEALRTLDTLLHSAGAFVPALVTKGNILMQAMRVSEARTCFEEALRLQDANDFARSGLAECLALQGKLDDAVSLLGDVLERNATWWRQWTLLGTIQYEREHFVAAIACYTKALQISGDSESKVRRAAAYIQLGKGRAALEDLDSSGVSNDMVLLLRGWAHIQLKQWTQAVTQLGQWLGQSSSTKDEDQRARVMLQLQHCQEQLGSRRVKRSKERMEHESVKNLIESHNDHKNHQ